MLANLPNFSFLDFQKVLQFDDGDGDGDGWEFKDALANKISVAETNSKDEPDQG